MLLHLVLDGVSDGALGVAVDVVATAERVTAHRAGSGKTTRSVRQRVVSIDGGPVRTASGRHVDVDGALRTAALGPGDVVVLPGVASAVTPEAVDALLRRADATRAADVLARAARRGATVAASCSSTFVLASSGLLDAKEATTTWWLAGHFAQRFPRVSLRSDRMVVADRAVLTAGAALAHADLVLAVLARTTSPTLAHLVASYLVLDERPSQARYMVRDHVRTADPTVRALERFVVARLDRQTTLAEMARATATSPRTLARRVEGALGTTPLRFAQRLRTTHAAHLLESTDLPVEEIAARVGYADAAAFRRVFRRETGEAPRARRLRARTR